jgi:hypothetical protein
MLHEGAKQYNRTLVLALEPKIMVYSTNMSRQCVCLPLKLYIVDIDDQATVALLWRLGRDVM